MASQGRLSTVDDLQGESGMLKTGVRTTSAHCVLTLRNSLRSAARYGEDGEDGTIDDVVGVKTDSKQQQGCTRLMEWRRRRRASHPSLTISWHN